MKVDELLKRLENIKIEEGEINENIDEKREITEYLVQTLRFDDSSRRYYDNRIYQYIMTRDKKIYKIQSYRSYGVSPSKAYVYIRDDFFPRDYRPFLYYYPFLRELLLLNAYLSKLGLDDNEYYVVPATGLKYVSSIIRFMRDKRVVIEVVDIDTAATNLNLSTLVHNILGTKLGTKYIDVDKYNNISFQLGKQTFFAGYTFYEAQMIINAYYKDHEKSLAKDVEIIKDTYNHIFQPYRVVYDLKTKQFIPT